MVPKSISTWTLGSTSSSSSALGGYSQLHWDSFSMMLKLGLCLSDTEEHSDSRCCHYLTIAMFRSCDHFLEHWPWPEASRPELWPLWFVLSVHYDPGKCCHNAQKKTIRRYSSLSFQSTPWWMGMIEKWKSGLELETVLENQIFSCLMADTFFQTRHISLDSEVIYMPLHDQCMTHTAIAQRNHLW